MASVRQIRPKVRFYMRRVVLCDSTDSYRPKEYWKPFCKEHSRWPCGQCGSAHYRGCACGFCARTPII